MARLNSRGKIKKRSLLACGYTSGRIGRHVERMKVQLKIKHYKAVVRDQKHRRMAKAPKSRPKAREVSSTMFDINFPFIVFFHDGDYHTDLQMSTRLVDDPIAAFLKHNTSGKYKVIKNLKRQGWVEHIYTSIAFEEESDFFIFMLLHGQQVRKIFQVVNESSECGLTPSN